MGFGSQMLGGRMQGADLAAIESQVRILRNTMRRNETAERSQDRELRELQRECDTLKLYLAGLLRLLVSRGIIAGEELECLVHVIDAEDGQEDGRVDERLL